MQEKVKATEKRVLGALARAWYEDHARQDLDQEAFAAIVQAASVAASKAARDQIWKLEAVGS